MLSRSFSSKGIPSDTFLTNEYINKVPTSYPIDHEAKAKGVEIKFAKSKLKSDNPDTVNDVNNAGKDEIVDVSDKSSKVCSAVDKAALTHVDTAGKAKMVDVADKASTVREAVARGSIYLGPTVFKLVRDNNIAKGDVMTVSQIAGIMGAKKTPELIPLCHGLNITSVNVDIHLDAANCTAIVECTARCTGKTGVEMEALTGVSIALLTIYDMCKAASKSMIIKDIYLVKKTGGKSDFKAVKM